MKPTDIHHPKFRIKQLKDGNTFGGILKPQRFVVDIKLSEQTPWVADGEDAYPTPVVNLHDSYDAAYARMESLMAALANVGSQRRA
jgi:hypothetical protein